MKTFWNDLSDLEDITNTFKVVNNCFDNSSYCDDLKESIDISLLFPFGFFVLSGGDI